MRGCREVLPLRKLIAIALAMRSAQPAEDTAEMMLRMGRMS
jgi:hypothetical protein